MNFVKNDENDNVKLFCKINFKIIMKVQIAARDNSVLQYSKKTQRVTYTQWLFTYPVLRQHKSESIGVFWPTSFEVYRSIVSILNNLCKYIWMKMIYLMYKLQNQIFNHYIKSHIFFHWLSNRIAFNNYYMLFSHLDWDFKYIFLYLKSKFDFKT